MVCTNWVSKCSPKRHSRFDVRNRRVLRLLCAAIIVLLAGCSVEPPVPEAYVTEPTVRALTPAPASTPFPPTATLPPAPTNTPIPTLTPRPTATLAPTTTPNPELADLGYCEQQFGTAEGMRFSAQLIGIETERLDLVDRATLTFSDTNSLLHGTAACLEAEQWQGLAGAGGMEVVGDPLLVLAVHLDNWAHDSAWQQSPITQTQTLGDETLFSRVSFAFDQLSSRGTTIGIGLRRAAPFRVEVEESPNRIIVEVDREARVEPEDDPLARSAGRPTVLDRPVFFLQNDDIWRITDERARPITTTAELETSLAVSPDGETLAVCRAPAGTEPFALPYEARASLWVMRADGAEQRLLADVGGCADLQFAPSGKTISFTANTSVARPAVLSVWTVPLVVGEPRPATPLADEWNRFGAQWLPDSRLIYRARDESGLSVLFIREDDGTEQEVSARLLTGPDYGGIGEFVVGDDLLAVEALRAGGSGADLALLRFDGTEVAVEQRGFWQRPLAFLPDGLMYLATECPSNLVQQYTILRRQANGTVEELLSGQALAGFGEVIAADASLLITRIGRPAPGLRGPTATAKHNSSASLWAISADAALRHEIHRAPVPIQGVNPGG